MNEGGGLKLPCPSAIFGGPPEPLDSLLSPGLENLECDPEVSHRDVFVDRAKKHLVGRMRVLLRGLDVD